MYIYIYSHTLDGSEIQNNHLGIPNPSKSWDKLPTTTGEFAGFLVESSTVFTSSSGCFFTYPLDLSHFQALTQESPETSTAFESQTALKFQEKALDAGFRILVVGIVGGF